MIKILAAVPLSYDATSYYRSMGVFPNLRKNYVPDLHVDGYVGSGRRTWAELDPYDILFLQRPAHPDWLALARYCKGLRKKIWVDHDDNLFQLPTYNRVHDTYSDISSKKTMLDIMKIADVVTVSTPAIKEYFESLGIYTCVVVPNALNEEKTPMATQWNVRLEEGMPQIPSHMTVNQFVWRGSETHVADLLGHAEEIGRAMAERPNTFWSYLGYNPFFITGNFDATVWKYYLPQDIMVYVEQLRNLKPQVMFVPLVQDNLNKCKSNIAWIESTAAGSVTIAPDWPEWQRPGIINYNSVGDYWGHEFSEDFLNKLKAPLEGYAERWQESRDYIMENLTITHVNKQRFEILKQLLK